MPDPCLDPAPDIALTLTGSPGALHAEVVPSLAAYNGLQRLADGLWAPSRPPLVTGSLPASPNDGDEIYFMTDPAADTFHRAVTWHLRYDASETTAFKWKFLGGDSLWARRTQQGTIAPSGANDWNTLSGTDVAGPSVTLPLAGYYLGEFGCEMAAAVNGNPAQVGISAAGNDPSADDVASHGRVEGCSVFGVHDALQNSYIAGTSLRLMYRDASSTGTASYRRRWIKATPVKVG